MHCYKRVLILFFFSISAITFAKANSIDSLLKEVNHINVQKNPLQLSKLYYQLGVEYYYHDSFKDALKYYQLAAQNADLKKDHATYYLILLGLGKTNKRLNNYEEALVHFSKILEEKNSPPNNNTLANTHSHLGAIYKALGEYDKAYQQQLDALHFHELEKDSSGIGRGYYEIGSILFYQKRFEQALEYYQKAHFYFIQIKHEKLTYASLAAMGSSHLELNNLKESLEYGERALTIANALNYKTGVAYSLGNVAEVKLQLGKMKEAKKMLTESLLLKEELNDNWAMIGGHLGLVDVYLACKMPKESFAHLEMALKLSQKIDSKTRLMETYQQYEKVYESIGNFPQAHFYLKKFTLLKDSVLNEKTVAEMGQAKRRFEMEKKESEIALLKTKNEVLSQKKENQMLRNFLLLGVGIVLFIAFAFNTRRLKNQRKTNAILEKQKKKIENQNQELKTTQAQLVEFNSLLEDNNRLLGLKNDEIKIKNKQLETSNEDLQNFAYVASHDLKEPLRMIHSYTSLLKRRYSDVFDDSGKEFMFFVTDAVQRMEALLDGLLNYSRVDTKEELKKIVDLKDVLLIVESNLTKRLEEEKATLIIRKENFPSINSNQTQLVQLFQNLVSNAIKFRGARDPIVILDCTFENEKYNFSIQDNGIGVAAEDQKKVFEMFKRLHTRDKYEGTGIGLATCQKIVQKHGGEIWLESKEGEGTTFFFSIPATASVEAVVPL